MTRHIICVSIALFMLAANANSAEPLRWKFAVGDTLAFQMEQQMKIELNGFDGPIVSDLGQQLDVHWKVKSVSENGDAVLTGKFDRIRSTMQDAEADKYEYDSIAEETPTGMAAMLAPMYEAMAASEYQITVTPRGEVRDVQIPEEVRERLEKAPGGDATGVEAGIAAFKATITQGFIPLPADAPNVGQTWSASASASIPGTNSATVTTEYKYEGTKQVDGTTYAVIRPTLTLELVGDEKLPTSAKDQTTTGEILFDVATGHLRSLEFEHHAALDTTSGGKTYSGTIEQHVEINVAETR